MSSSTISRNDNFFMTYALDDNEGEETEAAEENQTDQTSSWTYTPSPKRSTLHTFPGRIKRFFG